MEALISKPKLAGTMHAITVGTAHAKLLMQGLEALASENAALAVEVRCVLTSVVRCMRQTEHASLCRVPISCLR